MHLMAGDEGALLVSLGDSLSDDVLIGVASIWNEGCQDSNSPSVFVDIPKLRSWMTSSITRILGN